MNRSAVRAVTSPAILPIPRENIVRTIWGSKPGPKSPSSMGGRMKGGERGRNRNFNLLIKSQLTMSP